MSTTTDSATDMATELAASMFLSLFVTPVGGTRSRVARHELGLAVAGTGARGVRAAGPDGAGLVSRWERAGLVAPRQSEFPGPEDQIILLPRGHALLCGPFRWDRLSRALRRQPD